LQIIWGIKIKERIMVKNLQNYPSIKQSSCPQQFPWSNHIWLTLPLLGINIISHEIQSQASKITTEATAKNLKPETKGSQCMYVHMKILQSSMKTQKLSQ
jgi:hypothetical protein